MYARVLRKSGLYSCSLILGKTKVVADLTIPRAELRAAVMGAVCTKMLRDCMEDRAGDVFFVSDSSIVIAWLNQDDRPLKVAVRNGVI